MNRKISIWAAAVNAAMVTGFALSLIAGIEFLSYFTSLFIGISFVAMMCSFCFYAKPGVKLAGYLAAGFAVMYAVIIVLVYYAQMTSVRTGSLSAQAANLLDFQRFGLFFSYDMLGYALMSLATFFAGLTIHAVSKYDKWLKALLMVHGVFFILCFLLPLLGLFSPDMKGASFIGTAVMIFWCLYFLPVSVLSCMHFTKQKCSYIL